MPQQFVPKKINDLLAVAGLLDTHQFETDIGGTTSGKITGLQLKNALQTVPPNNILRVEPGVGNDITGDGTPQNPYESFQAAHDSLSPGSLVLLTSQGGGFVDQNITITRENTFILAPGVILVPSSGDAFTINSPGANSIGARIGALVAPSGNALNIIDAASGGFDFPIINGDLNIQSTGGSFNLSSLTAASCDINMNVGSILYANILEHSGVLDSVAQTNVYGRIGLNWWGSMIMHDKIRILQENPVEIGASITLSALYGGVSIFCTNGTAITITLPEESTVSLPAGWKTEVNRVGAGAVNIAIQGSDVVEGILTIPSNTRAFITKRARAGIGGISTWVVTQ